MPHAPEIMCGAGKNNSIDGIDGIDGKTGEDELRERTG
jgi:hypothetical protein